MSEKKAKEARREEAKAGPKVIHAITAQIYSDGRVLVGGIPPNFGTAMNVAAAINKTIASYFVDAARDGRMGQQPADKPKADA